MEIEPLDDQKAKNRLAGSHLQKSKNGNKMSINYCSEGSVVAIFAGHIEEMEANEQKHYEKDDQLNDHLVVCKRYYSCVHEHVDIGVLRLFINIFDNTKVHG